MKESTPLTYSVLCGKIDDLLLKYPFLNVSTIGKSLVGRDIPVISFGRGKKSVIYVGTHHSLEWITSYVLLNFINEACELINKDGDICGYGFNNLLTHRTFHIVPMLNPDGVELHINGKDDLNPMTERLYAMSEGDYSSWQANGRGVDLNHNYPAGFEEYRGIEKELGISSGCNTKYSGAYALSEPECSCLCSFIRASDPSLLIALHSQGEEIYYSYNGMIPRGSYNIARMMSRLSGYALSEPEGSACYGGLKDWFIEEFSRPAFTIECGKGKNPLPLTDLDMIYNNVRKILFLSPTYI